MISSDIHTQWTELQELNRIAQDYYESEEWDALGVILEEMSEAAEFLRCACAVESE